MPWRWTNPDARPVTEYLYDYHLDRKAHNFLYYCRECIRNFDTLHRIDKCPKCMGECIVELPKDARLERSRQRMKSSGRELKQDIGAIFRNMRKSLDKLKISEKLGFWFWKIRIAAYYFFSPMPTGELR